MKRGIYRIFDGTDRWFDHPDTLSSRVQTSRITRLGYEIRFMSKKQRVYRILRAAQIRRALHVQKVQRRRNDTQTHHC